MSEKLNLYQRINKIRSEAKTVGKDANVDNKYAAVTHDAVTRMIRPLLVKYGVITTIGVKKSEMFDTGTNWGKRRLFQYRGIFYCALINADNPDEMYSCEIEAHADDSGDKAPGKALSYAMKSFYLKAFAIETGEDDEQRVDNDKLTESRDTLSEQQLVDLTAKAEELFGDEADDVLQSMAENVFRAASVIDIESKHFTVAIRQLNNKAKRES